MDFLRDHCKSLEATYLSTEMSKLSEAPNKSTYVYNKPRSHTNSMNSKTQSFIASSDKPNISARGYNQKYENNTCAKPPKSHTANNFDQTCKFCQQSGHKIHHYPDFQALSVDKRFEFVKGISLCTNCLRPDHKYSNCISKHFCFTCERKHHTMLHLSARHNKHTSMMDTISSKTTDSACMVPSISTETPHQEICNTVSTNATVVVGTTLIS